MKTTLTSLISLGFVGALVVGFVNCGGTGGEPFFGDTFVNTSCNPNSDCMDLRTPNRLEVGDDGGVLVTLRNGDGTPSGGIQICCDCPGGGCTIIDPPAGCANTDGGGTVSGRVRCDLEGSHEVNCAAPSGFGIDVSNTMVCIEAVECTSNADCAANEFCGTGTGFCNYPQNTCVGLQPNGGCCDLSDGSQCISGFCDGGECASPPQPECNDGIDNDTDGDVDFPDDSDCTSIDDNDEGS